MDDESGDDDRDELRSFYDSWRNQCMYVCM